MNLAFYSGIYVTDSSTDLLRDHGSPLVKHHTTLVFSRKLPVGKMRGFMIGMIGCIVAEIIAIRHWPGADGRGYTVAILDCGLFCDWNDYFLSKGCENDFDYIPHITLDKGMGDTTEKYQGLIGMRVGFDQQYVEIMNIK